MSRNAALSGAPLSLPALCVTGGLLLTFAVTLVFRQTDLDLRLQSLVYSPIEPHWPYAEGQPWRFLHDAGTWPGLLLAVGATVMLGASFAGDRLARWRFPSASIFLLMAIGPGLITNLLGKQLCGRPRPSEIVAFGGSLPFHYPFDLGTPGRGFSFLCGHCSMGFLFYAFVFLLSGWKRWTAFALATLFGLIIGVGRVLQAAHFPSDVVLEATIMFTLAAAISPIASLRPSDVRLNRWQAAAATTALVVVLVGAFLFSTPVRKEATYTWLRSDETRSAATRESLLRWSGPSTVVLDVDRGDIAIVFNRDGEPLRIATLVTGFGFPGADTREQIAGGAVLRFIQRLRGRYWEVHGKYSMATTAAGVERIIARTHDGAVIVDVRGIERPVSVSTLRYSRPGVGAPLSIVAEGRSVNVTQR